jgi:GTP diphosphokinase / guanosine-3',5'-bis(diphosphate) 3'-diphosphatase
MPASKTSPPLPVRPANATSMAQVLDCLERQGRPFDRAFLERIYEFSAEMHRDQVRRSGEPYLIHPLNVAHLLADLHFDQTCVAVGLLHDVLEDTLTTRDVLEKEFGPEIAELVDGVTKIGRHEYVRRDEAQAETFRKMILASAKDIRVIVVKLADRLHNMQTLEHLSPEARRRISRETLEIYAPIAHRLGMARVRGELEDLAFFHLYPLQFNEIHSNVSQKMKMGQAAVARIRDQLSAALAQGGIDAEISFRVKRYYSIYEKLRRQGIDISQLYDYLAFRVVTRSLKDTYAALGVVHQNWRPIPGRFKDYIAVPKPNGYQSLHTTVVGERGQNFEVQMRTREMDLIAEEGIAAHWRYKEGRRDPREDSNILWLRQLLEWQQEVQDPRTFLTTLKIDLYPDEVYVFTPKGDVYSFPRGATPLDFAYRVHTDLGHHCAGARVNGKLVPLRTALQNGDMVEILTNPTRRPSRDWLNFAVTSRAKSKIRQWLNTQQTERATEIGRRLFEKEVRKVNLSLKKLAENPELAAYLQAEGLSRIDDLYSRIGFGKTEPRNVLERVLGQEKLALEEARPGGGALRRAVSRILPFGAAGPIAVKGQGDMLAYLAKCCNPLPGEEIVGYVTRGRGVSVHSVDCPNVKNLLYNPEREIEVAWDHKRDDVYQVSLKIEAEDRQGMLARLTETITKAGSNITQIEAETHETGRATIGVVCQLKNLKHLDKLMREVRAIAGVLEVDRRMSGGSSRGGRTAEALM